MKNIVLFICILLSSCSKGVADNTVIKTYEINGHSIEEILISKSDNLISSMELEIIGSTKGMIRIIYSHYPYTRMTEKKLLGEFDEKIITEWYDERCLIRIEPLKADVTGTVSVRFKIK